MVMNLSSMGTLFAFVIVCAGVLRLNHNSKFAKGKFQTPFISARFVLPAVSIAACILVYKYAFDWVNELFAVENFKSVANQIPMYIFLLLCLVMNFLSIKKNLSLIPVLGLLFCFYMMVTIPLENWLGFVVWLLFGLGIYFFYGRKRSLIASSV